ncbi:hypothetical protein CSA57_11210 [candidate division KSB3 bacterium]|nr:MAG: hypothetical protein CSA57_11210 [candidate division KSB3 bacterium]
MTKSGQTGLYASILMILMTICLSQHVCAQPSVVLIAKPKTHTITLGERPEKIVLKARTSGEVEFLWELDGPGSFEGDATTRELVYLPPSSITADSTEVTISVTVNTTRGESASDRITFELREPVESPFPTATPVSETVPPSESLESSPKAGNLYVLILGAEEYQDERIQPIQFAHQDAEALYEAFIDPDIVGVPEERVKMVFGPDFIDRNIKRTLGKWLSDRVTDEDLLLIYYTGYQAQENAEYYWLTFDAELDDLFSTAVSEEEFTEMLERLAPKAAIFLVDAAPFAAETSEEDEAASEEISLSAFQVFSEARRLLIQASDGMRFSQRLTKQQHGEFGYLLLQAFQGNAASSINGQLTFAELWTYLKKQTENNEESLQPVLRGKRDLDIVLMAARAENIASDNSDETASIEISRDDTGKERIIEIYRHGDISAAQFKKALDILQSGETDQILDDFLQGTISLEIFSEIF